MSHRGPVAGPRGMARSLVVACLLTGCSLGPAPLLDEGSAERQEVTASPVDGGTPSAAVDTPCGAATCTATQFCVRRYGGTDGGGLWPDHCATAATTEPTCADPWTNAACAPTPCRAVSTDGGNFLDCWGQ